jgi:hypothetical protein
MGSSWGCGPQACTPVLTLDGDRLDIPYVGSREALCLMGDYATDQQPPAPSLEHLKQASARPKSVIKRIWRGTQDPAHRSLPLSAKRLAAMDRVFAPHLMTILRDSLRIWAHVRWEQMHLMNVE